jgi:Skp family chaperone for outer membrane proteins
LTTHFFNRRSRETVCLFMAAMLLMLATMDSAAAAAESKQIMLLHSFGKEFKPWSEYAQTIREELKRQSPWWTVSRTHLRS